MKIECTIKRIGEHQSGVIAANGNTWHRQPIEVAWNETKQGKDGGFYNFEQSLAVELWGDNAKNFTLSVGQNVTLDLAFSTREYGGKTYNNIRSNFIILR